MDAGALQEAVDYIAITRVQSAYADVVSRRAWPEMRDVFRPDATVVLDTRVGDLLTLQGPDGVGEFIAKAIEQFEFFEFVILNTHVVIDGATATGRVWMQELRQDFSGRWTDAYGVYSDRYERHGGRWWIAGRKYHSLARTARKNDVFPTPSFDDDVTS